MTAKLLNPRIKVRLPELYSQEENPDPVVQVLLLGANGWVWALYEYSDVAPDGCPRLAFGKVYGDSPELGYVPMDELDELNARYLPGHGPVWVDEAFTARPLSQVEREMPGRQRELRETLKGGGRPLVKVTAVVNA